MCLPFSSDHMVGTSSLHSFFVLPTNATMTKPTEGGNDIRTNNCNNNNNNGGTIYDLWLE